MPVSSENGSWLAGHIFFHGQIYTPECDRVVLDVAEPFVRKVMGEGWADGYFFIRYSELGSHVRLRFHGDPAVLEEKVWPAFQAHVKAYAPDVSFERPPMPAWQVAAQAAAAAAAAAADGSSAGSASPEAASAEAPAGDAAPAEASSAAPAGDAAAGDTAAGEVGAGEAPQAEAEAQDGPQPEPGQVTHLAAIEYEPEVERYGGPDGVRLAERFFEVSSEASFALLHKTGAERSSRLGKGLLSMVVLVHTFATGREHATEFAHQYGINYLRSLVRDEENRNAWLGAFDSGYGQQAETLTQYVEEVWERLEEGESLSEALDAYHEGLVEVRDRFRALLDEGRLLFRGSETFSSWEHAVSGIVSSYVHMHNNRLGISIQEEAYLAYLIMRAMGRPAESVVS